MSQLLIREDGGLAVAPHALLGVVMQHLVVHSKASQRAGETWDLVDSASVRSAFLGDSDSIAGGVRRFMESWNASVGGTGYHRVVQSIEREGLSVNESRASKNAGSSLLNQSPPAATIFRASHTMSVVALLDGGALCPSDAAAQMQTSSGGGGVSLVPPHLSQSYLSSADGGTQSPRGGRQVGWSVGGIAADCVLVLEINSLAPRVLHQIAPLVAHFVIKGTAVECATVLEALGQSMIAIRASSSMANTSTKVDVSLIISRERDGEVQRLDTSRASNGVAFVAPARTVVTEAELRNACATVTSSSPMIAKPDGDPSSPSRHAGQRPVLATANGGDLNAIRAAVARSKPLFLDGCEYAVSPRQFCILLDFQTSPESGFSLSASQEALCKLSMSVALELYNVVLAELFQHLAAAPQDSILFGTPEDVERAVMSMVRAVFLDMCGSMSGAVRTLDVTLAEEARMSFRTTMSDLKAESFHIAQSALAGAMRPLAEHLNQAASSPTDAEPFVREFRKRLETFLKAPLLRADGTAGSKEPQLDDENLLTRKWATQAKKSASIDIVLQWFLPNTDALIHHQKERSEAELRHKDNLLDASRLKIAELESALTQRKKESATLAAQLATAVGTADVLQVHANTAKADIMSAWTKASESLQNLKKERAKRLFLEENTTNSLDEGSAQEHGSVAHDVDFLAREITALIEAMGKWVNTLGGPTHGLLIEGDRRQLQLDSSRPLQRSTPLPTPNISVASLEASSLNISRGLVRSPKGTSAKKARRGLLSTSRDAEDSGSDTMSGDIKSAREAAERERAERAKVTSGSAPPSPIIGFELPLVAIPESTTILRSDPDRELRHQEERLSNSMAAVAQLQQRSAALRDSLAQAERRGSELESRLRDACLEASQLKQEKNVIERRLHEANALLSSTEEALQLERREHQTTRTQLLAMTSDRDNTQGLLTIAEINIDDAAKRLHSLQQECDALRGSSTEQSWELQEALKRLDVMKIELTMTQSNANQYQKELQQTDAALQSERGERRETSYRYEQRLQEVLNKLDETVRSYEERLRVTQSTAVALDSEGQALRGRCEAVTAERDAATLQVAEITREAQRLGELNAKLSTEEAGLRRLIEELKDANRVLEIKQKVQAEDLRGREYQIGQLSEELRQSKEARKMLCHSMEALEMFIQEQKNLSEGGSPEQQGYTASGSESSTVHYLRAPPAPAGLSTIRAAMTESISRDEATTPSPAYTQLPTPAQNLTNNKMNASSAPISLSQLLHEDISRGSSPVDFQAASSSAEHRIVPLFVPPMPRNTNPGPRPLGPHLKALAAIETFLA